LTIRQPDVQSQGVVFSAVVIYSMNLLIMALTMPALSRAVTFGVLARSLGGDLGTAYGWTLDKLSVLWHDAAAFVRHVPHH